MFDRIADWIIERAKRAPYYHLPGYMNRWWLVPYSYQGDHAHLNGCGPVPFRKRPFAWVLQKLGIAVRVHEILHSDTADEFHDHPWNYIAVILKGGYHEVTPIYHGGIYHGVRTRWYAPGAVLFRRAESWHSLRLPPGQTCTTLFITFKYRQRWGFLVHPQYKQYYRDYFNRNPERAS